MRRFLTSQRFLQHFLMIYSGILTVVFAVTVLTAFRPAAAPQKFEQINVERINLLEERHLTGERSFDRNLRQRLYGLEHEVGVPLPRKAVRARNTVRLHAALLDWQETLLDTYKHALGMT